jgi:hypothetical protein
LTAASTVARSKNCRDSNCQAAIFLFIPKRFSIAPMRSRA